MTPIVKNDPAIEPSATATALRPYQREAIDAVLRARRQGLRRLLVSLPTGAGKTVIFSELARLAKRPVLVLAHREELLLQAREKLELALGGSHVVALERGAATAPRSAKVLVGSVRSLHEARLARMLAERKFGLIVYDECHHARAADNLRLLTQLGVFDPAFDGTLLGFTATTERGDGRGLDEIFEDIVYTRSLPELIEDGYLSRLRGYRIATGADLRHLSGRGVDFDEAELEGAVDIEERNALVARSLQELARDRRSIAFCVTVNHARNLARALNAIGVPSGIVHGAQAADVRAGALADFRTGRTQALTNVGVLTEGFDDPGVSCIAMARPTRSSGLYAQCVGRGTRLAPGKRDCLVLDFVDLGALTLCTLPSLFGCPRDLDPQGEDMSTARNVWQRIELDDPAFELEAGALTLAEIQDRARSFDPLDSKVHEEVRALSSLAWFSLGQRGVALIFERSGSGYCEVIVSKEWARGKAWQVSWSGQPKARFSSLEAAVEAVDYEVRRLGRKAIASAQAEAEFRRGPVPAALAARLRHPERALQLGQALELAIIERFHAK